MAAKDSHVDGNQQFSMIGVQGTLGTADVAGTAETMPVAGTPAWQQWSMATANTCTALIHRMKFTTRLLLA